MFTRKLLPECDYAIVFYDGPHGDTIHVTLVDDKYTGIDMSDVADTLADKCDFVPSVAVVFQSYKLDPTADIPETKSEIFVVNMLTGSVMGPATVDEVQP